MSPVGPAGPVGAAGPVGTVVLLMLAAGAVFVISAGNPSSGVDASGPGPGQSTGVLVDHAIDSCPRFAPPRGTRTTVIAGAAAVDDLASDGTLRHGEPGGRLAASTQQNLARGQLLRLEGGAEDPPFLVVQATGDLAAGLFTFQVEMGPRDTKAVTECASPAPAWWFTGGGATLDHSSELVLSNVDPGPAVVDVRVLGRSGPIETLGTRGITVPAGKRITVALADVAPQGAELAVSVIASRGRVVAAMSDSFARSAGVSPGAAWIPAQVSPSRVVHMAGLPGNADRHALVVANPSPREALVDVAVSGETGSFTPTVHAQVRVPPGSVVGTDITRTIGGDATAVTLRATVPVTATVRSTSGGDSSYASTVQVLTGPAVAPVVAHGTSTLQLTAGRQPALADVTAYNQHGREVHSRTVEVPAGATSAWSARKGADYLVVTPVRGQIHGAMSFGGDTGLAQVALRALQVRIDQPTVRPAFR